MAIKFNLDEFLARVTESLNKSSDSNIQRAAQQKALIELINDPDVRSQINALRLQGTITALGVLARLQAIFPPEAARPKAKPEPDPITEEEVKAFDVSAFLRDFIKDDDGKNKRFPF